MSEEILDANIENVEIVKKVNPHNEKTAWRSQGEKNDKRPVNHKEYFTNYYNLHCKDTIQCDKCDKNILKSKKARHQQSLHCRLAYLEKTQS